MRWAARDPTHTRDAPRDISTKFRTCGQLESAHLALDVQRRVSRSVCQCSRLCKFTSPAAPPETYAPISAPQGTISPLATGLVGVAAGALLGAGFVASRKFSKLQGDQSVPGAGPPLGGGGKTPGSSDTDPKDKP